MIRHNFYSCLIMMLIIIVVILLSNVHECPTLLPIGNTVSVTSDCHRIAIYPR